MSLRLLAALVLLTACNSGDGGSPGQDAGSGSGSGSGDAGALDGGGAGDGGGSDAGSGAVCTGLLYDACNPAASNCMGGATCKNYAQSGFSVCVPATCSANAPCPNQGGAAVTCNNMGFCKPAAPNADCTSP